MKPLCLLLFALAACTLSRADTARRPNILFAFADDWGRYASAYQKTDGPGSIQEMIKTPNFDRVAQNGVLFTNAFAAAPSCTPCRSSLLSGQYFWRTGLGAILMGAHWDMSIPSYPLLLQQAGYHIGYTLKVWSPGTPANAPYGAPFNCYEKSGREINRFSERVMAAQDHATEEAKIFDQVKNNFDQFLRDAKPDQPWCYWFGPTNTHRPYAQGSGEQLWGIDPSGFKGKLPSFLPDNDVTRRDMSDYFGEGEAFDQALGVLIKEVEDAGQLDNTIIVVSGDQGMGGMPRGKTNLYDFGERVTLAVSWPAKVPPGRTVDDFVNQMDLAPTFLEAGGVPPLPVMTGHSFLDILTSNKSGQVDPTRTYAISGRERHVAVARDGNLPYPMRDIRTAHFLYIRNFAPDRWPEGKPETYADIDGSPTKNWMIVHQNDQDIQPLFNLGFGKRPLEELYDTKHDPDQVHNLADDPAYAATKKQLSDQLMQVLVSTADPRVTGDGKTFDRPPYAGPVQKGAGDQDELKPQ